MRDEINVVSQLRAALREYDCVDMQRALDIGRTAALKGDPIRDIVSAIRRNMPDLFPKRR